MSLNVGELSTQAYDSRVQIAGTPYLIHCHAPDGVRALCDVTSTPSDLWDATSLFEG